LSVLSKARKDISDRISAIRKQDKTYTEDAESGESTEKSGEKRNPQTLRGSG
jgi:hypothetical protein